MLTNNPVLIDDPVADHQDARRDRTLVFQGTTRKRRRRR
jgi:hypothetical protein